MPSAHLKIGFVLDDSLDKTDGVQQYVLTLASWLTAQGHEVHYLVGQTRREDLMHVHSLGRNMNVRFNHNRMTMPLWSRRRQIKALLAHEHFDVLHVQMPYSPVLAGRIILTAPDSTAIVGTFHIAPFSNLQTKATKVLSAVLRPSLRQMDYIVSVSALARDFARESLGVYSEVIPNTVILKNFQRARTKKTSSNLHVVFLGRLVARKGCLQFLRAIARLHSRADYKRRLQVTVAGKGPLIRALQRESQQLGIQDGVSFKGYVTETQKSQLFANADLAVFPSLGGESFGIVLLEAMAAGAGVVIGGNNPGYQSVLQKWPECLFDPRDEKAFADIMDRFLTTPRLRDRIHKEQQTAVKSYDVEQIGPLILRIYKSAIAKKRAH